MNPRLGRMLVLLFVSAGLLVTAQPAPSQTLAVATIQSLDALRADGRYLLTLSGHQAWLKQFDEFNTFLSGNKGLSSVDTKQPLGLYVTLPKKDQPSTVVFFVPITNPDKLLDQLKEVNNEVAKGKDGVYAVSLQNGTKGHLRFAHKYVYFSEAADSLQGKLPDPVSLLADVPKANLMTASFRFDQFSAEWRKLFIQNVDEQMELQKAKRPQESDANHRGRVLGAKLARDIAASLLEDGKQIRLNVQMDRKRNKVILDSVLSAKPGTKLARSFTDFGARRSSFGTLTRDAAASVLFHMPIAEPVRQTLGESFLEGFREGFRNSAMRDGASKEEIEKVLPEFEKGLKAIEASLRTDIIDFAAALRGPGVDQKYIVLIGAGARDGQRLQDLVRELVKKYASDQREIKLDHVKVKGTSIHLIEPFRPAPPEIKRILGSEAVCFAIQNNRVLLAVGEHGLEAIKEVLQTSSDKAADAPVQMELSVRKLVPLFVDNPEQAADLAAKLFPGADKNKDTIRMSLLGGDTLRWRLEVDAPVVRLLGMLNKQD